MLVMTLTCEDVCAVSKNSEPLTAPMSMQVCFFARCVAKITASLHYLYMITYSRRRGGVDNYVDNDWNVMSKMDACLCSTLIVLFCVFDLRLVLVVVV